MILAALLRRVVASLLVFGISVRYGLGLAAWRAANRLERPAYETIAKIGRNVEVRRYAPYIVAEATITGTTDKAGSGAGFRACAGFLFGSKNKERSTQQPRPMAMTAPVRMNTEGDTMKVSFVMAKNESLRTLPVPTESIVKLRQLPAHTAAFLSFPGGRPSPSVVDRKRRALDAALRRNGLFKPKPRDDATLVYGYHDPFITPAFLRRNEVGYFVEPAK